MSGTLGTQDVEARLWQDPFEALDLAGVTASRAQDVDIVVRESPKPDRERDCFYTVRPRH